MTTLLKRSALSGVYRMNGAKTTTVAGWDIAESFGDASREQKQLAGVGLLKVLPEGFREHFTPELRRILVRIA